MSDQWRNELATEKQKEKLRFFGCTWDDGITTGQAEDALAECAIQYPEAEATWQKNQPAREDQIEKLRYFGCTWNGDINVGQAIDALLQCAIDFPDKEAAWQFQKTKWSKIPVEIQRATTIKKSETVVSKPVAEIRSFADKSRHVGEEFLPTPEQLAEIRAFGKVPPKGLTFQEATTWIEQLKIFFAPKIGRFPPEPPIYLEYPAEPSSKVFSQVLLERLHSIWTVEVKQTEAENRRRYDKYVAEMNEWNLRRGSGAIKQPEPFPNPPTCQSTKELEEWLALQDRLKARQNKSGQTPSQEVTIQEASKPQNTSPSEYTIPAREVQNFAELSAVPNNKVRKTTGREPKRPKYISYPREPQRQSFNSGLDYDYAYDNEKTNWIAEVKSIEAENRRRHDIYCAAIKRWYMRNNWNTDWEPQPFPKSPLEKNAATEKQIPELPNSPEKIYAMYCPDCGGQIQIQMVMVGKKQECPLCRAEIVPVFFRQKTKQQISPPRVFARIERQNGEQIAKPVDAICPLCGWSLAKCCCAASERTLENDTVPPRQDATTPSYYSRVTLEQLDELRSLGENPTSALIYYGAAKILIENCKTQKHPAQPQIQRPPEVTNQEVAKPQNTSPSEYIIPDRELEDFTRQQAEKESKIILQNLDPHITGLKSPNKYVRKVAVAALGRSKDPLAVKPLISCLKDSHWAVRVLAAQSLGELGFPDAVEALIELLKGYGLYQRKAAADALGQIKDARAIDALAALALEDPRGIVRKAATLAIDKIKGNMSAPVVQDSVPRRPAITSLPHVCQPGVVPDSVPRRPEIQKPTAYSYHAPIERFAEWVEGVIGRNQTFPGGNWLPAGPLNYAFAENIFPTISFSRQIADTIESKGYCVEPDARFGSGTYDRNQTLALFKPLDGDPIQPSTAYLGAANLLRLCILITTADGKIDLVELDLFRQVIEKQDGLTLTDHKRLLVLEQLLAQELCSATKTAAKIAKSVPADKRLVIAHLLVQVAAANNEITRDERRALEKIFKAFAIPLVTLENYIYQICSGRATKVYGDVSKNNKWLWNHWRTGHPGVVLDDDTLAGKTWNFTDWKALNARWRSLHERLVARQSQASRALGKSSPEPGASESSEQVPKKTSWLKEFLSSGRKVGASAEQIQNPDIATKPRDFALDMERVYQITNETKEVVAILSVVMADEPEESIKLPSKLTLPAPDIAKVSSDSKDAPQPARFNGLDAAFHPILERLLTRESWPVDDFDALAREFHFMPGKICEIINEWSDEALGEFILDGDDPVVIRRELIVKETIYG
jgi:uncharacterized tellurite resistance protein B-like protein